MRLAVLDGVLLVIYGLPIWAEPRWFACAMGAAFLMLAFGLSKLDDWE
jgi:hypothetical protein